jgi:hypothetical protein
MTPCQQCPVCFGGLEVRVVEPCHVCGGWPNIPPSKPDRHFTIRNDGGLLTLCNLCWLEEALADQGDLKQRLKIKDEHDLVVISDQPSSNKDKFCPACHRRLALLSIMAHRLSEQELEHWRK